MNLLTATQKPSGIPVHRILPRITTKFDQQKGENIFFYRELLTRNLLQILPEEFFTKQQKDIRQYLHSLLPLTSALACKEAPGNISFFILMKYRPNAFKFFFEMISRSLVPGKRLDVLSIYAVDFMFPDLENDTYTLCELIIRIENEQELAEVKRNLPSIDSEICLGVASAYYARRILEVKGLSNDEKTAMIQEYIAYIIKRQPAHILYDAFTEMQHVLVTCKDEFKAIRSIRHLSRIICVQYLFRQDLGKQIKKEPDKRHLSIKIFRTTLQENEKGRNVVGLFVGVNFLKDKEIFDHSHLLKAIQNYIPKAKAVKNSLLSQRRGSEPICTLYLEIEKEENEKFTNDEITLLKQELPSDLEGRIENLTHSVFMPRNEEEIMRNILTLGNQIRYIRDIPQMNIAFDHQTHTHLFFTVIFVRLKKKEDTASLEELFKTNESFLEYIQDRTKIIGTLRRKYPKEATVFNVKIHNENFLRRDHSIDLYKARQTVAAEICRIVGETRDYNGGMISKQNELLTSLRSLLKEGPEYDEFTLQNFFYSLNPVIMRTVLEPETLKKLFLMMIKKSSEKDSSGIQIRAEPNFVFVVFPFAGKKTEGNILAALQPLSLPSASLATTTVIISKKPYLGYIYVCDDPQKQRQFCVALQHAMQC